jgi:hypothetical protein
MPLFRGRGRRTKDQGRKDDGQQYACCPTVLAPISNILGTVKYLVLGRPGNDLTGGDLGRLREQGSDVLFYKIRGQAIRFFLCFSSRKNAYRNHYTVCFVHPVVRDEAGEFINQWYEFFLYPASRLFRICDALISANC